MGVCLYERRQYNKNSPRTRIHPGLRYESPSFGSSKHTSTPRPHHPLLKLLRIPPGRPSASRRNITALAYIVRAPRRGHSNSMPSDSPWDRSNTQRPPASMSIWERRKVEKRRVGVWREAARLKGKDEENDEEQMAHQTASIPCSLPRRPPKPRSPTSSASNTRPG
ncbi:hypothetical protein B0H34DRAFT_738353 [Crassisporium funariophilum]|nr:hypothetical protein B0H34DRAFT_738353 [Crassisporium funariophilum]